MARSADGSDSGKAVLGKAWARLGQAAEKAVNNLDVADEPVQLIVVQILARLLFQKVGAARILQQRQVPKVRTVRHNLRHDAVQVAELHSAPDVRVRDSWNASRHQGANKPSDRMPIIVPGCHSPRGSAARVKQERPLRL